MSDNDPASRYIPPLATSLLVALFMYGVVMFAPRVLYDGDTFWQLAAGQKMLELGRVLKTDPFSYTMPGATWHTHEWLSEIFFALAYRAGRLHHGPVAGEVRRAADGAADAVAGLLRHVAEHARAAAPAGPADHGF